MKLYINTKDQNLVEVVLKKDGKIMDKLEDHNKFGSQALLPLIQKLLKKNKISLSQVKEIEVEKGPGSFTGLRVGVSVANALGFGLNIKINGKTIEDSLSYT